MGGGDVRCGARARERTGSRLAGAGVAGVVAAAVVAGVGVGHRGLDALLCAGQGTHEGWPGGDGRGLL